MRVTDLDLPPNTLPRCHTDGAIQPQQRIYALGGQVPCSGVAVCAFGSVRSSGLVTAMLPRVWSLERRFEMPQVVFRLTSILQ